MNDIFISYARTKPDRDIAERLNRDLVKAGLSPWTDSELIGVWDWNSQIALKIRECRYFLALFSGASLTKRGYVQQELRLALDVLDSIPIDERFLIPIRLTECTPMDARLARLQWVDFFPVYKRGPRWTPQNRPFVDGPKPAISGPVAPRPG
jgi:TIR domain